MWLYLRLELGVACLRLGHKLLGHNIRITYTPRDTPLNGNLGE